MDAYEAAIRSLVKPGDVVLDVGAGTGVLSMLAARRGAARVHAVESMGVAGLARELVAANGLDGVVKVHQRDFVQMEALEAVDVIVSDFMGRFVVDDAMLEAVEASERWLKPGGVFCPGVVRMRLAPVGDIRLRSVDLFDEHLYGLVMDAGRKYALNYCYHVQLSPEALMAPPVDYRTLRPPKVSGGYDRTISFVMQRPGAVRGLAGWFEADMSPGVVLSTQPGRGTHWGQYLFTLPHVRVEAGDGLEVRLRFDEDAQLWRWSGRVERSGATLVGFDLESEQRLGRRS